MSKAFDPYHKWLAIPPRDQPPNHYRLLGIDLFEPDPDVISNAADMRMTLVRSFQSGKHSEQSQQLLNEISAARVCLLDAEQRQKYDEQLRGQLPAPAKPPKLPSHQPASPDRQSPWKRPVGQRDSPAPEFEPDWTERAQRHDDPRWYRTLTGGIAASLGSTWRGTIAMPRKADGLLRSIAGEGNVILLIFLRTIPVFILIGIAGTLIWIGTRGSKEGSAPGHRDKPPPVADGSWQPEPVPEDTPGWFGNSIGMEFVLIRPGEFMMGAAEGERRADEDEAPRHPVRITKPFYMGIYEVTQEEYERVMGENPSRFRLVPGTDTHRFPVELVSWNNAVEFCRKLSSLPEEQDAGRKYRLPTEAEWEYACRADTDTLFGVGKKLSDANANIEPDDPEERKRLRGTTSVGSYKPNAWALYDMHGNVWEWCSDWYDIEYYRSAARSDPRGPPSGDRRVARGGCYRSRPAECRAASRTGTDPDLHRPTHGFRVVCPL